MLWCSSCKTYPNQVLGVLSRYVVCRSSTVQQSTLKGREYLDMCAAGWDLFRFECPETLGSPGLRLACVYYTQVEGLLCIGASVAASYLREDALCLCRTR